MSRRPSIAFSIVISSVYSMSLPTGMPMAMRVTFTPRTLELMRKISRSRFAFNRRIRRHDDLIDVASIDAGNQIRDAQLLGPNPVQRRDGTVQHMEHSVEMLGVFSIDEILVGSSTTHTNRWLRVALVQ